MSKVENRLIGKRIVNAYLSSVVSISLVLLLVGLSGLLIVNTGRISGYFKENVPLTVLLKPEVSDAEAGAFLPEINALHFVKGSRLVTKAQGRKAMEEQLGTDFLDIFETPPIPASFDLTLKAAYMTQDSLRMVQARLERYPLVEEVACPDPSLIGALNANLNRISIVSGVLTVLLLFISFVLINNMMRLIVYSRRFTVHTMQLVGATNAFIRRPFLAKSAVLGLFSALIAILLLLGLLFAAWRRFPQLSEIFNTGLLLEVIGLMVVFGLLICVVGTYFVVGRLLALSDDERYGG